MIDWKGTGKLTDIRRQSFKVSTPQAGRPAAKGDYLHEVGILHSCCN